VTVGSRALKDGQMELQERRGGERTMLPLAQAAGLVAERVRIALQAL
jgi:prolyl-tRNA synthetase